MAAYTARDSRRDRRTLFNHGPDGRRSGRPGAIVGGTRNLRSGGVYGEPADERTRNPNGARGNKIDGHSFGPDLGRSTNRMGNRNWDAISLGRDSGCRDGAAS